MRSLSLIGLAPLLLAGCASVIDTDALPAANMANDLALAKCAAAIREGAIRTASALGECYIDADRAFVATVKLKRMDLFESYAARVRLAAEQADKGLITPVAFGQEAASARQALDVQVTAIYQSDEAKRSRTAAAFSAMGAGLQQAGAAYNAGNYTPPPSPTVICRTTPGRLDGGGGTTTVCN